MDTINRCETQSPRFHAFLKINQAKRECGRQTLAELLINPVQRVPRIILLLQGLNMNKPLLRSCRHLNQFTERTGLSSRGAGAAVGRGSERVTGSEHLQETNNRYQLCLFLFNNNVDLINTNRKSRKAF